MTQVPEIFDRALLRRRRARVAGLVPGGDFLLRRVAEDFALRLAAIERHFPRALDLGCHHGVVGEALRRTGKVGEVIGAESCLPLLRLAEGKRVACDEEALPFAPASFSLVVSALALHFVNDLPGTLAQIRRTLVPDGLFLGALLGGRTLQELRAAFLEAEAGLEGGASPRVAPFADMRDLGALLQRAGFAMPVSDTDVVTVTYPSPLALMRELRAVGASNVLRERSRSPLKRTTLARAIAIYEERFGGEGGRVPATFEIVTLTGWAPHRDQPRPLRPGSAEVSLADVLGKRVPDNGQAS